MTRPHYINGRILLREPGGINRVASEVAAHIPRATVLAPRSARTPLSGRLWEQTVLGRQSADGVLLNPGHGGPMRHPRQVNVIYDLIALTHPQTVHPAFAALMRRQLPRLINEAKLVVTLSQQVADDVMAQFGVAPERLEVVRPGIADAFAPVKDRCAAKSALGLDPERLVVSALLDPTPRKNSRQVALTLQALRRRRPELQIVVAGRTSQPSFGRTSRARSQGSNEIPRQGFVDLGAATDEDLAKIYRAADVFLSLTSAEGFGLPAVEAMQCGAAVVSTRVPSLVECAPGCSVLIEEPRDAIAAVEGLLDSPARRASLAVTGMAAIQGLRWASTGKELGALLSRVGTT